MRAAVEKADAFVSKSFYRVLYADIDRLGIVYNGNYLRYFEQARGDFLRQQNMPYTEVEKRGISTPLTEAYAHYFSAFKYEDEIEMDCWISHIKRASFRFDYRLYPAGRPDDVRVTGFTVHATIDREGKVCKIPQWLLDVL